MGPRRQRLCEARGPPIPRGPRCGELVSTDVDVLVVGAGLSGLVTATELERAGASVAVLEARDRVGGKTCTVELDGCVVDLGAHWIGPGQDRMYALAAAAGLRVVRQDLAGEFTYLVRGRVRRTASEAPALRPHALADLAQGVARLDRLARRVPLDAPWDAPGAAALDRRTLADWRRTLVSAETRSLLDVVARVVWGAEPHELSLLYVAGYLAQAGGFEPLISNSGGAQQDHILGGTQPIAEHLARALAGPVLLDAPVRALAQDGSGVRIVTDAGEHRAARAVVALAPALLTSITFDPPLPTDRALLAQRMPMGQTTKVVAAYERPFWRDDGQNGIGALDRGPVTYVADTSPEDGHRGMLTGFVVGDAARRYRRLGERARRAWALRACARLFGPAALRPLAVAELDWAAEEWSRGAPTGIASAGVLTGVGHALREPHGRVAFAGTETARSWTGYMEGAAEAGERAARETLGALGAG